MNSSILEQRNRFAFDWCTNDYCQPDVFILYGKFFGQFD